MRFMSVVVAALFVAPLAFADDGVQEAGAALRHAENDYQPSARGGVGIRTGSDFERFSVGVEGVSELATLRILLGNGRDEFVEIGTLAAGSSNRQFLRTTMEGGRLPLEAARSAELSGRAVRVIDGESHLILFGEVPFFAPVVVDPPVEPPRPAAPVVTRAHLLRPEGSDFHESRGVVVATDGQHEDSLRCEVGRLAPETGYLIFIGEGESAVILGDLRTNGEGGGSVGREAAAGQALTDRLPSLADLGGRHVEVRNLDGVVVLYGRVPEAQTERSAEPEHHEAEHHDEASGADCHVELDLVPERGHERFEMDMSDLPRGDRAKSATRGRTAQVMMDDGTGNLAEVANVRISRRGRARLVYNTRRGDALPLGAATLRELAGRGFEVRVNGSRAVGGNLPIF